MTNMSCPVTESHERREALMGARAVGSDWIKKVMLEMNL